MRTVHGVLSAVITISLLLLGGCSDDDGQPGPDAGDLADARLDAAATPDASPDASVPPTPCDLDYDCPPGEVCRLGFCEPFVPECNETTDCTGNQVCLEHLCLDEGFSPDLGAILINEVLTDGSTDEDANGDGTVDAMEDEFIELVNVSNRTIDLEGWTLVETDLGEFLPRHTFGSGVVLEPLDAVVVFGGGEPPQSTIRVLYLASNAADPGIPFGLDLDDGGDLVRLLDEQGLTVAVFAYGDEGGVPATSDQSLTRDPDLTGDFVPHTQATVDPAEVFSPGTRHTGAGF